MNRQQRRAAAKSQQSRDMDNPALLITRARQAMARENPQEAIAALGKLVELRPTDARGWRALGQAWSKAGDGAASLAAFDKAVALDASNTAAWAELAMAQQMQNQTEKAIGSLRHLIALDPAFPGAVFNLAAALKELGRIDEAIDLMRTAANRDPGDAKAEFNLGLLQLTLGHYEEGWDAYEARLNIPGFDVHTAFPQPRWDGGDISGKTLLVHAEQGLGDVIQFARYLPMLKGRANRILFAVPQALTGLFKALPGVDELLTGDGPAPEFDCHCPLLSLPRLFGTRLETIPADGAYLHADEDRLARMAERFAWLNGAFPKIGLVWAGKARPHNQQANRMDGQRSLRLSDFAPLAQASGKYFVSLQEGPAAAQVKAPPAGMTLLDPMPAVQDFADTAAIVAHLDLVISVDTAVAHLAGALGKPVWILSRFDGCWRWLRNREDSPWYPTARLFRQSTPGDWNGVIHRVAGALAC